MEIDNEKQFAIKLAHNEKEVRSKAFLKLRNYLKAKSASSSLSNGKFNEDEMIKIWKGLHYCMWMCDKLIVQQDLAEKMACLIECFQSDDEQTLLFIKIYFKTIIREWNGIDKWRMDKFMYLMRWMLNRSFDFLKKKEWDKRVVNGFLKILFEFPLNINSDDVPDGVCYHFTDLYIEELAKHSENLKPIKACKMISVFAKAMAVAEKKPFITHLDERFFKQIIDCSDVGVDEEMEREMNEIKAYGIQRVEPIDNEEYTLHFNHSKLADIIYKHACAKYCLERNKKTMFELVKEFRLLAEGVFPLTDYDLPSDPKRKKKKKKKINKKSKR